VMPNPEGDNAASV